MPSAAKPEPDPEAEEPPAEPEPTPEPAVGCESEDTEYESSDDGWRCPFVDTETGTMQSPTWKNRARMAWKHGRNTDTNTEYGFAYGVLNIRICFPYSGTSLVPTTCVVRVWTAP